MKQSAYVKLAMFFLLALAISTAWAQMPQPFSADMTVTHANGQKMAGKFYFSAPKMRVDITSMANQGNSPFGGPVSTIMDTSTQTTYILMPQMQMYMETHAGAQNGMNRGMQDLQSLMNGTCPQSVTCKKLGSEAVNGRSCDKYEVTDKNGKTSTMWVDQKLHFPIRSQEPGGTTSDFTNIKEGAQDASLFQVPPGYKPFDPAAFAGQQRKK